MKMRKYKDWARCAYYNRWTFSGFLVFPAGIAFGISGLIKKDSSEMILGATLVTYSISANYITTGGIETFESYNKAKRILEKKGYIPSYVNYKNKEYCNRRGVELAVHDFKKNNKNPTS